MKKNLLLSYILLMLTPLILLGQTPSWPYTFAKPKSDCTNMPPASGSNCSIWAVSDGDWNTGSTWNTGVVPANGAVVCIPAGKTVQINTPTYTQGSGCPTNPLTTPTLYIFVCGTIDFKAGGKLYTGCGTNFNIYAGGRILASNGNSDLINIAPTGTVWGGAGNQNIYGPYYITGTTQGAGVLPVKLIHFNAQLKQPYEVTIDWATASETNSFEFEVERSYDYKSWISLTTIKAKGNSNSLINYSYIDKSVSTGINYYRLKQIDANGNFVYSSIARITNRNTGKIVVYPNPVSATATLYSSEAWTKNQALQIVDVNGALVQSVSITGGNTMQFSTNKLSAGLYLVRVIENGKTVSQTKLIKQ